MTVAERRVGGSICCHRMDRLMRGHRLRHDTAIQDSVGTDEHTILQRITACLMFRDSGDYGSLARP